MKRLIGLLLILLSSALAHSQGGAGTVVGPQYMYKRFMFTGGSGYGLWQGATQDNQRIGGLYYIPPGTPPPQGWPTIIFLHGVGEKGGYQGGVKADTLWLAGPTLNDASVDALANTVPFSLLKLSTGSLVGRTYNDPIYGGTTQVAWVAVQDWGDDKTASTWGWYEGAPYYLREIMLRLQTGAWASWCDASRIYLTGLSFGGGWSAASVQDSVVNAGLAAAQWNCMGYDHAANNTAMLARSGLPVRWFSAINDGVADPLKSTAMYTRLMALDPLWMPEFYQFTDGDAQTNHDIWQRMYNPSYWGVDHLLTNGDTYNTNKQGNPVEWFLQFRCYPEASRRPDQASVIIREKYGLNYIIGWKEPFPPLKLAA